MTPAGYSRRLVGMTAAAVALVRAGRRTVRVEVQGWSMAPALLPGDRLVAVGGLRGRPGDIVAVADPRVPDRLLIKRVAAVEADGSLRVRGDDPTTSTDSRTFGAIPPALMAGRVIWRYWPRERRGWVPAGGTCAGEAPRGFR